MPIRNSIKAATRVSQTFKVLSGRGLRWLRGDRPELPQLLRETFEELGTTYIKLGQFIASSPSIFPPRYVSEFQRCLDRTPPLPFEQMRRVMESDLQKPLSDIFAYIDPEPLASASIAQVHAARLRTGTDVVVKIQKPGVQDILLTDLNFVYFTAKLLERMIPDMSLASLSDIVNEIQQGMLEECDFLAEARNIEDFKDFLQKTNNTQAVAPTVYYEASSLRVLTMERLYGVPFTDLESIRHYTNDPEGVLISAMNTWFSSLMYCTSFHADVHAGNLLVLKDGRIGFIDFGIVGRIAQSTWASASKLIEAISHEQYRQIAEAMLGIGMTKEQVNIDELAKDIEEIYKTLNEPSRAGRFYANGAQTDQEINRIMIDIVSTGKRHGIHFPREFALLLKQLLYFDRYVRLLTDHENFYIYDRLDSLPKIPDIL